MLYRLQVELRAGDDKTQLDLQKKDQTLQTIAKDLQHKKDLCSSLKKQLSEASGAAAHVHVTLCYIHTYSTYATTATVDTLRVYWCSCMYVRTYTS